MKKANKFLALLLAIVMAMSFTVISSAKEYDRDAITEYEIGLNGGFDLLPETQGASETFSKETYTYSQKYRYTSQVDCLLNFQVCKDSSYDEHTKDGSTYDYYVAEGNGNYAKYSEEEMANFPIKAKVTYHIELVRHYKAAVKDAYIGYTAKLNPTPLTQEMTPIAVSGEKDLDAYYVFKPAADGGYVFNLEPTNGYIGENKNYQVNVYSKIGSSVYESAAYEKGESKSVLRLYLKGGTEYIVEALGYGEGELGYTFTVENVPVGPGVALVGAPALSLDSETACTLYPFANRKAFAWYSFTAPKEGSFEFVVNNNYDAGRSGDIVAELRDETFSPTEDEDVQYVYEKETGVLTKDMKEGEVCYIQVAEMYRGSLSDVYNVGLKVREHAHTKELFVDGDYVSYGCPCQNEGYIEYAFWLDAVKASNATYTGKNVTPKAKFEMNVILPDDGSITPKIPDTAYTITVTSKNKKNIGKAKAKIKFSGAYKSLGTRYATFNIVPKGTSVSKVSAAKAGFTAKWNKQTKMTSGYELRYSTNSVMIGAKKVAINSNKTVSKKVSKLKSNTTYYAQVRTYKTVSGKKYYSSWSAAKEVTTK